MNCLWCVGLDNLFTRVRSGILHHVDIRRIFVYLRINKIRPLNSLACRLKGKHSFWNCVISIYKLSQRVSFSLYASLVISLFLIYFPIRFLIFFYPLLSEDFFKTTLVFASLKQGRKEKKTTRGVDIYVKIQHIKSITCT